MIRSTLISLGLHSFLLTLAYFGLPALKTVEPIELPIDIVEDTPVSSKTSLKLGDAKEKKNTETNKKFDKKEKIKKNPPPPPPSTPPKKVVEKKITTSTKELLDIIETKETNNMPAFRKHWWHLYCKDCKKEYYGD